MHRRRAARLLAISFATFPAFVVAAGCLDRDVVNRAPSVSTIVSRTLTSQTIDKVDLLFVIDNSASMGDKQQYLAQAVPDLITRLVTPSCVDPNSGTHYGVSDKNGHCAQGQAEFPPVHDLHVGLVSTALGSRLSDQYDSRGVACDPSDTVTLLNGSVISKHNDDRAELLTRAGAAQSPLSDAAPSGFLNYFPDVDANAGKTASAGAPAITDPTTLQHDFAQLVAGVGTFGCGIESQLESWYRFLVQPDPYDSLTLDANRRATWSGVDTTLLKQRHDFLRPDSLVAIIDLTDENDSEIDVRALSGTGYFFMSGAYDPLRGTTGCAENAAGSGLVDPSTCTSCQFASNASSDPSCQQGAYSASNDWGYDMNLRHVHMTQKYGLLPQFPVERYALGLTSTTVPDRSGEYPTGAASYQGLTQRNCQNPLFAAKLPDGTTTDPAALCNLTPGPRTADLVYYAHIGGVPHQLLQQDPNNPDSPQKDSLTSGDWTRILGRDPEHQDYTGVDPHMLESYQPRPGLPAPTSAPAGGNPDPIDGREWITDQGSGHVLQVDREYACTFALPAPRDCTNTSDPNVSYGCDCPSSATLSYGQLPPICDPVTQTQQVAAKAYPTVRELLLAKQLGDHGIVSSLCPIHVSPANGDNPPDPLYGYRPAMNAIVDRLGASLQAQCSPQKLAPVVSPDGGTSGEIACLVLVAMPPGTPGGTCAHPGAACDASQGLYGPSSDGSSLFQQSMLDAFCAEHTQDGADPQILPSQPVCALRQIVVDPSNTQNCATQPNATPGWCYVQGPQTTKLHCSQPSTIVLTRGEPPSGAVVSLQCLESAVSIPDATSGG